MAPSRLVLTALGATLAITFSVPGVAQGQQAPQPVGDRGTVPLASSALRQAVERLQRGDAAGPEVDARGAALRVEVLHRLNTGEARRLVQGLGGTFEGEVPGVLIQALVPFDRLVELERTDGVDVVRPPLEVNEPVAGSQDEPLPGEATAIEAATAVVGEEVGKTNASAWHAAGFRGSGVKVGIIDSFDGDLWSNAQTAGELPAPSGTFCQVNGSPCDIWASNSDHGEGVAEIIHEMAPAAQLYLATAVSTADLQAAVNYFVSNGIKIVSRSLTSRYDGAGDGTGPIATVIDNAVANGITWFQSAGNNAGLEGNRLGTYWRGSWSDGDGDGWLDFAPGDEFLGFYCDGFVNGLRWSDWGSSGVTDYDVYIYDNPGDPTPQVTSVDNQGTGAPPLEIFNTGSNSTCPGDNADADFMAIRLHNAGAGTAGDALEFMMNRSLGFEYWQNPFSASGPAADTASPGGITVGAIDPAAGTTIAPYSSQGPTNDGRIKPNLSAASCVASYTFAPGCFNGTSAATPVVAGAAALVREAGLGTTPNKLKKWLQNNATVDRGVAGSDNVYGRGELILPAPPPRAIAIAPPSGPTGTPVTTSGGRFSVGETVNVKYKTGLTTPTAKFVCSATVATNGNFSCGGAIPTTNQGALGAHTIVAKGTTSLRKATTTFTLTN